MCGAWQLPLEEGGKVKEHDEEDKDMPVLRETLDVVYISSLRKFVRDFESS